MPKYCPVHLFEAAFSKVGKMPYAVQRAKLLANSYDRPTQPNQGCPKCLKSSR